MNEELKVQTIKPNPNCKYCHSSGEVYKRISYGFYSAIEVSFCNCVEIQCNRDTDEIILDIDEQREENK